MRCERPQGCLRQSPQDLTLPPEHLRNVSLDKPASDRAFRPQSRYWGTLCSFLPGLRLASGHCRFQHTVELAFEVRQGAFDTQWAAGPLVMSKLLS